MDENAAKLKPVRNLHPNIQYIGILGIGVIVNIKALQARKITYYIQMSSKAQSR